MDALGTTLPTSPYWNGIVEDVLPDMSSAERLVKGVRDPAYLVTKVYSCIVGYLTQIRGSASLGEV